MGLALGVADLAGGAVDDDVVILDLDRVVAVEQLPGADFLVLRLDGVELGAVQLVEARLAGEGVGQLRVIAGGLEILAVALGLDRAPQVLGLGREGTQRPGAFQAPDRVVLPQPLDCRTAAEQTAVAIAAGIVAAIGGDAAHAHARADPGIHRAVLQVAIGVLQAQVHHVARLVQRREHAAQVVALDAVAVGIVVVLAEHAAREESHAAHHRAGLDTGTDVVVDPVGDVVGEVALQRGDPFGAGGLFQAEVGVEATELQVDRVEAGVGDRSFVEIAVVGAAGVVRQVEVDLVFPVLVCGSAEFDEGAAEVGGVGGVAILGIETVETAVVGLQATAQLEAEFLVGGGDFEAALGLDHDIGAVGGHGAGERLGRYGQSQSAGNEAERVLTDHRRFPLNGVCIGNTRVPGYSAPLVPRWP
ncbi:hypothetical protein ALP65_04593 [Pseudomonas aeruginosa]|uniref:Uncharacterized protein n=1 Tax=Pseudomonas aeruginosa TaxID=287 RepID=A0A3M5DCT1_PSEAI|nr:hypothetical protein ALP65_04593 [Pseudomonas aeruginosa]